MKNKLIYLLLTTFSILVLTTIVSAGHVVTNITTVDSVYNVTKLYNISIQNTDLDSNNITLVNITLPAGLVFDSGSEGTDIDAAVFSFSNTSVNLLWENTTSLIDNQTTKYFWFNATPSLIGSKVITVKTTNSSGIITNTLTGNTADVNLPTVSLASPATGTTVVDGGVNVNFIGNFTDDYQLSTSTLYIWDSLGNSIYTNLSVISGLTNSSTIVYNFPSVNKAYKWNYRVNDTYGNVKWATANFTYTISGATGGGGGGSAVTTTEEETTTTVTYTPVVSTTTETKPSFFSNIISSIINFFNNIINKIRGL